MAFALTQMDGSVDLDSPLCDLANLRIDQYGFENFDAFTFVGPCDTMLCPCCTHCCPRGCLNGKIAFRNESPGRFSPSLTLFDLKLYPVDNPKLQELGCTDPEETCSNLNV